MKPGTLRKALAVLLCGLWLAESLPTYAEPTTTPLPLITDAREVLAFQSADILRIRPQVERLIALRNAGQADSPEALALRAQALRKTLSGYLDVRRATNHIEVELAYTYAVMDREHRKQASINEFLNLLNFAQFSVFYTLEPYSRQDLKFKQSAEFTCIGAGLGLLLPVLGIINGKFAKAHNTAPPKALSPVLKGGPVDARGLPDSIDRFLDSTKPGQKLTRREEMFAVWKKRTGCNPADESTLCSLQSNTTSFGTLNNRIVLLWSLHTFVEDFDNALLALLTLVRAQSPSSLDAGNFAQAPVPSQPVPGLTTRAMNAARLLDVQSTAEKLSALNRAQDGVDSPGHVQLELKLLEAVMSGLLEMTIATDRIDGEVNYSYDVILSTLLMKRGKGLQKNFEANFIQSGVFSAIAGLLFLKGHSKAGNQMFVIESGIGTLLSSLALVQLRGGSRKIDTPPNSLSNLFKLETKSTSSSGHSFSPLVVAYLNSPTPQSTNGETHREYLLRQWKARRASTMDIDNPKNQIKLGGADVKYRDTIKIVQNRLTLLHSLRARLNDFDADLFDLVRDTGPHYKLSTQPGLDQHNSDAQLSPTARGIADILRVRSEADELVAAASRSSTAPSLVPKQLWMTRRLLYSVLDVSTAADVLDLEIDTEREAADRLKRMRDLSVQATNTANFFQINVLGLIIDGPLSLTGSERKQRYANRLNIVSGLMVGGLAGLTVIEGQGGIRLERVAPNTLASVFSLNAGNSPGLSQQICDFLNTPPLNLSTSETRMQILVNYWKQAKILKSNVSKQSVREKLAAVPAGHRVIDERLKLMTDRIRMLKDVKAIIQLMNDGTGDLLQAID